MLELTTPAFLIDILRMRANCVRMRDKARASGVIFRPHVKTHKTIDGARMQHEGGFGPITVSTLAEAEFFAAGGFKDITYAVPIAPEKLWRAAELASRIERLNILIDSHAALRAVEERGQPFDVFLKIDCGYHRAGVSPDDYVFCDAFQAAIGSCSIDDVAVSVLATVVGSYPERRSAIIDAGALALSKDLGADHIDPDVSYGIVCDVDLNPLPVRLTSVSQEHGKLEGIAQLP